MDLIHTLLRPLVTEKSTTGLASENTYGFEVAIDANKHQIRTAVERFYGVDVAEVRTLVVRGKFKRFGRHAGKRSNWKKAYVTLAEGQTISVLEA
jgi:large subunit ribosomal protein L23